MNWTQTVQRWYEIYLRRQPDAGGLQYWIGVLEGGTDQNTTLSQFLGAGEYYSDAGGSPQGFVSRLYHDIGVHHPSPTTVSDLVAGLTAGTLTQQQVAYQVITSQPPPVR